MSLLAIALETVAMSSPAASPVIVLKHLPICELGTSFVACTKTSLQNQVLVQLSEVLFHQKYLTLQGYLAQVA